MTLVQGQLIYSNPHRLFLCVCVECVGGENEVSEMPSLFHFTHSFFLAARHFTFFCTFRKFHILQVLMGGMSYHRHKRCQILTSPDFLTAGVQAQYLGWANQIYPPCIINQELGKEGTAENVLWCTWCDNVALCFSETAGLEGRG